MALGPADEALLATARALPGLVRGHMGRQALNRVVEEIFAVCDAANKYVEAQAGASLRGEGGQRRGGKPSGYLEANPQPFPSLWIIPLGLRE